MYRGRIGMGWDWMGMDWDWMGMDWDWMGMDWGWMGMDWKVNVVLDVLLRVPGTSRVPGALNVPGASPGVVDQSNMDYFWRSLGPM
jgi:hypothetical protein